MWWRSGRLGIIARASLSEVLALVPIRLRRVYVLILLILPGTALLCWRGNRRIIVTAVLLQFILRDPIVSGVVRVVRPGLLWLELLGLLRLVELLWLLLPMLRLLLIIIIALRLDIINITRLWMVLNLWMVIVCLITTRL